MTGAGDVERSAPELVLAQSGGAGEDSGEQNRRHRVDVDPGEPYEKHRSPEQRRADRHVGREIETAWRVGGAHSEEPADATAGVPPGTGGSESASESEEERERRSRDHERNDDEAGGEEEEKEDRDGGDRTANESVPATGAVLPLAHAVQITTIGGSGRNPMTLQRAGLYFFMARIKGFAIRGLFRYLKERRPGITQEVVETLSPATRSVLERPIITSNMYPYETFTDLLRGIDAKLGRGDLKLCREIGDAAARQDMSGVFKVMLAVLSPRTTLQRSNLFWSKYCDTGSLVVVSDDPDDTRIRLEGFTGIDEAHCQLMVGWIGRFAMMTGGKDVVVEHSACVHHGATACEWSGRWLAPE
jgi:hypothetical protein